MPGIRFALLAPAVLLVACSAAAAPDRPAASTATLHWPATELSRHVQAYFAQLAGDDSGARTFLEEHMAPAALAEAGIDARLERRRAMLAGTRGLVPLEVLGASPTSMSVRCRAGNGDAVVATFDAEAAPGHRLLGVRLEASTGPGGPRARPAGPPLEDGEAAHRMRTHLDERAAAGAFSGVALLARGDSTLLAGAWGLADRAQRTPVALATRFNLASIGKMFTRTAIAQLCERGALSLDDRLSRYLPDFPHADSITLDMLCAHRSGVGDIFNERYRTMDHSRLRANHDYLALIRDQPLWFVPGTGQRYSNGGYVLLGEVIAKASGEDYDEYLAEHVFAPAGMHDTGAPLEGDGTPGLARGYTREGASGGSEVDNAPTRPAHGSAAGGGYSTAGDLLAFDRALFAGKLCSPGWAAWVAGGARPGAGDPGAPGAPGFAAAGGAPGVSTEWLHEGDRVLIVLTNRDPEVTKDVLEPVHAFFGRMRAGAPAP